jgi:FkbM family methyltransferase
MWYTYLCLFHRSASVTVLSHCARVLAAPSFRSFVLSPPAMPIGRMLRGGETAFHCPAPSHSGHEIEAITRGVIAGLFAEGFMPLGSVIDAGANSGEEACEYAAWNPTRMVHAIEPLLSNVRRMRADFEPHLPNLAPRVGGLSGEDVWLDAGHMLQAPAGVTTQIELARLPLFIMPHVPSNNATAAQAAHREAEAAGGVHVQRIDDLFRGPWKRQRLGFAHIDVEGAEVQVFESAVRTIKRDRPVFTFEAFPHTRPAATRELLKLAARLLYRTYVIEEECGVPADCRNILAVPKELKERLRTTATYKLAFAHHKIYQVAPSTIDHIGHKSCRPGGACFLSSCSWQCVEERNRTHPFEFVRSAHPRWGREYALGPVELAHRNLGKGLTLQRRKHLLARAREATEMRPELAPSVIEEGAGFVPTWTRFTAKAREAEARPASVFERLVAWLTSASRKGAGGAPFNAASATSNEGVQVGIGKRTSRTSVG